MKKSRNKPTKPDAVELTDKELGEVTGGSWSGPITLTSSSGIGNRPPSGGDFDLNGTDEIIVGAGPGAPGGHVK